MPLTSIAEVSQSEKNDLINDLENEIIDDKHLVRCEKGDSIWGPWQSGCCDMFWWNSWRWADKRNAKWINRKSENTQVTKR